MHAPVEIDIEDVEEQVSALLVSVASDGVEESGDSDITAYDRIQGPTYWYISAVFDQVRLNAHHSVPRNVTPSGVLRKTSWPLTWTIAPSAVTSRFPAKSWRRVDFPAR